MNNLTPIKNCPGVQGNLIWMPGYSFQMNVVLVILRSFLSYKQTVHTPMKCRVMRHFIWVFTVG